MALLTAASFPDVVTVPTPKQNNVATAVANPTNPVTLKTSTGTWTVFNSVSTALLCMEHLRINNLTYLNLPNNIRVVSVVATKLMILETTPALYDLVTQQVPIYLGGAVLFIDRKSGVTRALPQALQAVGICSSFLVPVDNYSLQTLGIPLQIVDVKYQANAANYAGSQSADVVPLVYTYTNQGTCHWAGPYAPATFPDTNLNAQYSLTTGGCNLLTTPDDSGNLVKPTAYLQASSVSVTLGFAFWITGSVDAFWPVTASGGTLYTSWDGSNGSKTNLGQIYFQVWGNQRIDMTLNGVLMGGVGQTALNTAGRKVYILWTYTRGSASNSWQVGMYNVASKSIQPITLTGGANPTTTATIGPWATSTPSSYLLTALYYFGPPTNITPASLAFGNFVLSAGNLSFSQAFPYAVT